MIENKRFIYREQLNGFCDVYDNGKVLSCMKLQYADKTVNLLNDFDTEVNVLNYKIIQLERLTDKLRQVNIKLTEENQRLQRADTIADLETEISKLKQQNDRQAKQLNKLYRLIEEKDWIALSDIIDDFKQCEEQLQKEWGTYCDFE